MSTRFKVALAFLLTVLTVFVGRLMWLQLAQIDTFATLSQRNYVTLERVKPLRGRILARDGTILADNRVAYDLMYWGGPVTGLTRIEALLGREIDLEAPDPSDPTESRVGSVAVWNLPDRLVPAIEERVAGQRNLYLRERIERIYPTGLAAQTVGYTGLANPEVHPGYQVDDMIGVSGLEAGLQDALFGEPGLERVERNHLGTIVRRETVDPATPGSDVVVTLDPRMQQAAEAALAGATRYMNAYREDEDLDPVDRVRGALVAMDSQTGEILAMASAPTFDPNVFTRRPSEPEAVAAVLNDQDGKPLQNRVVEAYPPASTFKLVSSYTLLEEGYVTPRERFECTSSMTYGGITWRNWAESYRGNYDVQDAIADSCNTYYWAAALRTPDFSSGWAPFVQALTRDARLFGYGEPVGVPLPDEKIGRVPDQAWTEAFRGTIWFPGYTLNTSIGQGDVLATPLQTLRAESAFANRGVRVEPRLVASLGGQATQPSSATLPGSSWDTLLGGMRKMVTDYSSSRILGPEAAYPIEVAGKTGTAQNTSGDSVDHAWFMAHTPAENPQISVVAFLENAGSSTRTAVPVVRDFFDAAGVSSPNLTLGERP